MRLGAAGLAGNAAHRVSPGPNKRRRRTRRPQQPAHATLSRATSEIAKAKESHPEMRCWRRGCMWIWTRRGLSSDPNPRAPDQRRFRVCAGPFWSKRRPLTESHSAERVISPAHYPALPIVTRRAKTTGLVRASEESGLPKAAPKLPIAGGSSYSTSKSSAKRSNSALVVTQFGLCLWSNA